MHTARLNFTRFLSLYSNFSIRNKFKEKTITVSLQEERITFVTSCYTEKFCHEYPLTTRKNPHTQSPVILFYVDLTFQLCTSSFFSLRELIIKSIAHTVAIDVVVAMFILLLQICNTKCTMLNSTY